MIFNTVAIESTQLHVSVYLGQDLSAITIYMYNFKAPLQILVKNEWQ